MPRKRAKIKQRIEPVEPWLFKFLATGVRPEHDEDGCLECFMMEGSEKEVKKAWLKHKALILRDWIERRPGTRPFAWWEFESPEPRRRVGGKGTPSHEVLSIKPWFLFGVPRSFVSKFKEDYYNGRFKCKDPWMQKQYEMNGYKEGDFEGVALDLENPPMYEAQASYLKRHGLLTKAEEKRLKPKDFEPESCLKYVKNT